MQFMMDYLHSGDDVLDVGENVGVYTVLAASLVNPGGTADAVEAVQATARRLIENVELNLLCDCVTVHHLAVGSEEDWVEMTTNQEAVNHMTADQGVAGPTVRVRAGRLDHIATRCNYAFGKIDIEGREWDAFRGAQGLLRDRNPPVCVVEVNGALFRYGHQVMPFVAWMAEFGFEPWTYEPDSRVLLREREKVWGDVFFVARDRLDLVKERIPRLRIIE